MSQMYPSSSHQLVAAAFRRARKKFPTNFGQLNWPVNYSRRDSSKSEPFSSTTTMSVCKNCEERFSSYGEIHNSRSSNVWPSLVKRSDPRSTRSTRENATSSIQRNSNEPEVKTSTMASARSVCPCRRNICSKSRKKQNFAVSFGGTNERSQDRRISGGDARDETISRKTCPDRVTNDCPTIENKMKRNFNYRDTASRYAKPEIPSKLNEWESRTNSLESRIDRAKGNRRFGRVSKNCDCENVVNGQLREESTREENRRLKKTERCLRDSSISEAGKPRSIESGSSSFGGTNRLCKDCSLVECSRNSSRLVSSLRGEAAYEREDEHEDRVFHDQELCAIKHKDSLAILVEKFKNKKIPSSDEETTIYKSDEDCSENESTTNLINKKERSKKFRDSSTEEEDESDWIKSRKPKSILGPRTLFRASKPRTRSCGHCCSTKHI